METYLVLRNGINVNINIRTVSLYNALYCTCKYRVGIEYGTNQLSSKRKNAVYETLLAQVQ